MPTYYFKNKDGESVSVNGVISVNSITFDKEPLTYLKILHDGKHQIHCDCTTPDAVSHVCLLSTHETYYLKQSSSKPHDDECPLVGLSSGEYNPPTNADKLPQVRPYLPGKKVAEKKGEATGGGGGRGTRQSTLYTMLCHLLAGKNIDGLMMVFNRYTHNKNFNWDSLYFSLLANKPFIERTKFSSLLKTPSNLKLQPDEGFIIQFTRNVSKRFPPQIYTIAVSNEYNLVFEDGNCKFTDSNNVERSLKPRSFSHRFKQTKGARLFFFSEAYIDGEWIVPLLYSHPIVSLEIPILVDSNYERVFFKFASERFAIWENTLTSRLRQKANNAGDTDVQAAVSFSITKPYFAKTFYHQPNVPLIPDFKLSRKFKYFDANETQNLLVEVMGINDPVYDARKAEIIPAMERRLKIPVAKVKPETMTADFNDLMTMKWSKYEDKYKLKKTE